MRVHLIDGTYELFRYFYAMPSSTSADGLEVGAIRGVLGSVLSLLEAGATHVGVATDHVIESFRNDLWPGYKTGEGIDPLLLGQFHPLEETLTDMGVDVFPMIEFEADDGLAAAAVKAANHPDVEQVIICTPDKDLAQMVTEDRIVQMDRRANTVRNEAGVVERFGVPPASIPDLLALVGDSSDGYPGVKGWGAKSAAAVLARYLHLEGIPEDEAAWEVSVRGAARLNRQLRDQWDEALLFRRLATLRTDAPVFDAIDELEWRGPAPRFFDTCARLGASGLFERAQRLERARGHSGSL
jgi:5'-3' exonuclease